MLDQQTMPLDGANGSIMVGMFVYMCLASKKPSKQEFFAPTLSDLGDKLLTAYRVWLLVSDHFLTSFVVL